MIHVNYNKKKKEKLTEYEISVKGHGEYAEYGKDIVCAAVSMLFTSAAQTLADYNTEHPIKCFMYDLKGGNGYIQGSSNSRKVEGVFDMLITGIEMVSDIYPENVAFMRSEQI